MLLNEVYIMVEQSTSLRIVRVSFSLTVVASLLFDVKNRDGSNNQGSQNQNNIDRCWVHLECSVSEFIQSGLERS